MRSSFNFQLFCDPKSQYLQTNVKISITAAAAAAVQKRERKIKKSMKLWLVKTLLNMYFLKYLKSFKKHIF
jgi:hypothetical protein